jgi:two-component system sensor histidine kinase YcbA
MDKSYSLYKNNKNNEIICESALDIARDIHEIKKDYYRVLVGFENFLKQFETNETMSFKDLSFIIESNSKRYIDENNKDINLSFVINDNIYIKKYYSLFTILNNLITNSIDSIKESGNINIVQNIDDDYILLTVCDDGGGIGLDLVPFIFNPGFTTKYDKKTGNSSTGIGLSHVKNIIDELSGEIKIESISKKTEFKIVIPKSSLII